MKVRFFAFLCGLSSGCLFSGDGTLGLPCNTDTECGGTQRCIEQVCGGPEAAATEATSGDPGTDASSSGDDAPMTSDDDDVRTECEASETQCLDDNTLRLCTEEGKLSTRECDGWCGQGTVQRGCHTDPGGVDTCFCLNPTDPCTDEGVYRCDGNNLTQCTDGFALPLDCDTVCIEAGYPGGSDHCGETDGGNSTCFCLDACIEGATRCVDDGTMAQCSGGTWSNYGCDELECPAGTYSRGCTYFDGDTEGCGCWEY